MAIEKTFSKTRLVQNYKEQVMDMLHLSYPTLTYNEIEVIVDKRINETFRNKNAKVINSYKHKEVECQLSDIVSMIEESDPVLTTYGVLFRNHNDTTEPNLFVRTLMGFLAKRKLLKKELKKYEFGTKMYNDLNLAQLLKKLSANKSYGLAGAKTSIFYDPYVAGSITQQARSAISVGILFFEAFLTGNIQFGSLDEVIVYIRNILLEERKFDIDTDNRIFGGQNIPLDDVFVWIMSKCGFNNWYPSIEDMNVVYNILHSVSQRDLNRLYYKNNLVGFCECLPVMEIIVKILTKLNMTFLNPNTPSEEIEVPLNVLCDLMEEYVFYNYMVIDKMDKASKIRKNVCIYTHTDSSIVSLDFWYRYILDKVRDIPMAIKDEYYDKQSLIDGEKKVVKTEHFEYGDVYDDGYLDQLPNEYPDLVTPPDSLRYSIINIMSNILSKLSKKYLQTYSAGYNALKGDECKMVLKNEFLFKRMFILPMAKTYASIRERSENNIVPLKKQPFYVGMRLDQNNTNAAIQSKLKDLMNRLVLRAPTIDQGAIMRELENIKNEVYESLKSGSKDYYRPTNIKSISSYKNPMSTNGIKGAIIYNALRRDEDPTMDLEKKNAVYVANTKLNLKTVEKIKDTFPDVYEKAVGILNDPTYTNGEITSVSILKEFPVPKWLIPFIDYDTIVYNNISTFPSKYLQINDANNNSTIISNIISL